MEITKPALLGGVETRAGEKQKRRDRLKELRRYLIVALASVVLGLVVIYARRDSSAPVSFVRWLAAAFRDPVSLLATLAAISAVTAALYGYAHRNDPYPVVLPPYPPDPDLRFCDDLLLGRGWTWDGKMPGAAQMSTDPCEASPFVTIPAQGIVGNLRAIGAIGSRKTEGVIKNLVWQILHKFPAPGADDAAVPPDAPSVEERARLHREARPGMFLIDAKGNLSEWVMKAAAAAGRGDDVIVLRPGGPWTYNPLLITENPTVLASQIVEGARVVAEGETGPDFYRLTMSEWLANAIQLILAVDPSQLTIMRLLELARDESLRARYVDQAEALAALNAREDAAVQRRGRAVTGYRIDPNVVSYFRDFDRDTSEASKLRTMVLSGIKSHFALFVERELREFLSPDGKPTFAGFAQCFNEGKIVVLRLPMDQYDQVGRTLGILTSLDFQQVARRRLNDRGMNRERLVYLVLDEMHYYVTGSLATFLSVSRESRVPAIGAHQSLGQTGSDQAIARVLNDNFRTNLVMTAPNAEAGAVLASMIGEREVLRTSVHETTSVEGGVHLMGRTEMLGQNVGVQVATEAYFPADELVHLPSAEAIAMVFDGDGNRRPRRMRTPLFYEEHLERIAPFDHLRLSPQPPHPVIMVSGDRMSLPYFTKFVTSTYFLIASAIVDAAGRLRALRFTSEHGTAILPLEFLDDAESQLSLGLQREACIVAFPHSHAALAVFWGLLELPPRHPLFLDAAATAARMEDGLPASLESLAAKHGWDPAVLGSAGAWERIDGLSPAGTQLVDREARALVALYRSVAEAIHAEDPALLDLVTLRFGNDAEAAVGALSSPITALRNRVFAADGALSEVTLADLDAFPFHATLTRPRSVSAGVGSAASGSSALGRDVSDDDDGASSVDADGDSASGFGSRRTGAGDSAASRTNDEESPFND